MNVSAKGVELIASFEGFRPHPYDDPAGHATIGFGHLIHRGPVTQADRNQWGTLTRQQGLNLLAEDLVRYCEAVSKHVRVRLNQNQFDALTSFTFNVGAGALARSTLCRRLNDGDYDAVPSELAKFNRAGGKVLDGLTRRRKAEAALFMIKPTEGGHVVAPQYHPPFGPIAATLKDPQTGGVWLGGPDGALYAVEGARAVRGANGKPYFAGRILARLELSPDGRPVIIATSGERYGPNF